MIQPQVVIIIPTLNEEVFIARCLDSIIAQTYPLQYMDILVVDGGSSDATIAIVQEYHTQYPNIRLLNNPGRIQAKAFNIGLTESSAPYIIRLDAHAYYFESYVFLCVSKLKEDSTRGNVGGVWDIRPSKESVWAYANAFLNSSRFGIGGAAFRVGEKAGEVDTVPFGAFPRRVIEHIGGMREDLPRGEDNEFNYRIRSNGYKIYFDPDIRCVYYARPDLTSSCKQMYANGVSIGHLAYIAPKAIGVRHLIPLLFVLGLILGPILSLGISHLIYVVLGALLSYLICATTAAIGITRKFGYKYFLPLLVLFPCVHISYGLGTIYGLYSKFTHKG